MRHYVFALSLLPLLNTFATSDEATKKQTPLQTAFIQHRELTAKYRTIEKKVFQDKELVKLRDISNKASEALKKKIESLSVKERQAEKNALDALNAAINKQIATSPEIAKLQKERQELEKKRRDLQFQIGLHSFHLYHQDSPLQQELDQDEELQKLKKAYATAKDRKAAFNKYNAARRAKLHASKGGKTLLAKIKALEEQVSQCDKDRYAIWQSTRTAERKIQYSKEDKALQPFRDKLAAAKEATRKVAQDKSTNELREAANNAAGAYYKKRNELTSASKELMALKAELNELYQKIRNLREQEAEKPSR